MRPDIDLFRVFYWKKSENEQKNTSELKIDESPRMKDLIPEMFRRDDLSTLKLEIRGLEPDARRAARQHKSLPLIQALEPWLRAKLETISQKTKLAEAIRYALSRWVA